MLLLEDKELAQPGVLLRGRHAVARGLLRVGELAPERFVLREQTVVFVKVAVYPVEAVHRRADDLPDGGDERLRGLVEQVRLFASGRDAQKDDEGHREYYDGDAHAVFFHESLQTFQLPLSFLADLPGAGSAESDHSTTS